MLTKGMPQSSGVPGGSPIPMGEIPDVSRRWLDLVYAHISPSQKLDIYLPEAGDGPFPVLFYMHGGGFQKGDKRDVYLAAYVPGLEYGYALVSVNYRLSGEAPFPVPLQDCKAALRWLRANGDQYELDTHRLAAVGHSSGGNFAAMMCVSAGVELFEDPALGNPGRSTAVQAALDWYGPTDFSLMDVQLAANGHELCDHSEPDSPESKYLGAPVLEVPDKVAAANPVTYVNTEMAPILIQHGRDDCGIPVQQSIEFARAIEERVGPDRCELDIFDGAQHSDQVFTTPKNLERVYAFLDKYLK